MVFGIAVIIFLWVVKPFDIDEQDYSFAEISIFGLISFLVFAISHTLIPALHEDIYPEQRWTVYHQIFYYLLLSFIIATLNGLYINVRNDLSFSWSNYGLIIRQTLIVGVIAISLIVFFSYSLRLRRFSHESSLFSTIASEAPRQDQSSLNITSDLKSEDVKLTKAQFLFAKSSGNYVELYSKSGEVQVLRLSLKDLESQLTHHPHLLRCHRSYMVNLQHITEVDGNAQGLRLSMRSSKHVVLVSRKYLNDFKSAMQQK